MQYDFSACLKTFYAAAAHQPLQPQLRPKVKLKPHRHLHQLLSLWLEPRP